MLGLMSGNRVQTSSTSAIPLDTLINTGVRANTDVDAFATAGERQAAVLLWNYHDADEPAPASSVSLSISGLPDNVHRVLVQHYRIDDTHSNAYTVWKQMGSPQQPTTEQYAQLQASAGLQLLTAPLWAEVANGKLQLNSSMPRQSISLVKLTW